MPHARIVSSCAVLVIGHRGASALEPENTMRAFARALDDGADGVELDVRLAASGELVVAHDPSFRRCAGDPREVGRLSWGQIRELDVGRGEPPPLLDDVLDLVLARGASVHVEVKTNGPRGSEVAAALAAGLVRRAGRLPDLVVSSFDPRALATLRWRAPRVATGLLFGASQAWALRSGHLARVLDTAAVHPERWLADARRVSSWHRAGRRVHVWTVDDPAELRRLQAIGADAVFANDPGAARAAL